MNLKSLACATFAAAGIFALSGCAGQVAAPVVPAPGFIYTDYSAPLDTDLEEMPAATREGRSSTQNILGLIVMGDASMKAAMENGGITTAYGADYEHTNILGIIATYTTVVYGD